MGCDQIDAPRKNLAEAVVRSDHMLPHRMNFRLFVTLACLVVIPLSAQEAPPAKRLLYFEAGGGTLIYSINFERIFDLSPRYAMSARAGAMYLPPFWFGKTSPLRVGIPVGLSLLREVRRLTLETGVTFAGLIDSYPSLNPTFAGNGDHEELIRVPSVRIGIRNRPMPSKLFWNVALQCSGVLVHELPVAGDASETSITPWFSAGIGYGF